ncbi:hypothetical protein K3G69_23040 [Phytobacter diazotrophicus]|nr:hypothetical protein [Phytobacter diazotrophicus]
MSVLYIQVRKNHITVRNIERKQDVSGSGAFSNQRLLNPGCGQCLVGSLTGAVSSQRVTEEHEGWLILVGHQEVSAMA